VAPIALKHYFLPSKTWRILYVSILLIIGTAVLSIYRVGFTLSGFLKGDGGAVLGAASALISIWALIIGFSIAAIGATFELSKLPANWKILILRRIISDKLMPFFILALLAGIIPFLSILHTRNDIGVFHSQTTPWLIIGFLLQLLLIISGALAAIYTYQELTLISAIKSSLSQIDYEKMKRLQKAHAKTFNDDIRRGNIQAARPFSLFVSDITGAAKAIHDELVTIFKTLLLELDPQEFESGIRVISEWAEQVSLHDSDSYIQYKLLPTCYSALRSDQTAFNAGLFRIRIFFLSRLINVLYESNAYLSASNSSNPVWDLIDDYANKNGMSQALILSMDGSDQILISELKHSNGIGIFILNLSKSIQRLARERNSDSLNVLEWILEWYRRYIEVGFLKKWPANRNSIKILMREINDMYRCIDEVYYNEPAIWAGTNDLRFWILVTLRRMQEEFVDLIKPEVVEDKQRAFASQDFEVFSDVISELIAIRCPEGDKDAYNNRKYPKNPYSLA
jgi:hypothetical protein